MRLARAWRTALVSASCAMPMISRSTPPPKAGSSSTRQLDRHVGRPPRQIGRCGCKAVGDVLARPTTAAAARRPSGALRSCACAPGRWRSRCSARPPAAASRAERCAACSCIRMAAKPCASVSWMSRAMRLRSSSTAWRRASRRLCSARRLWCSASVAWRAIASSSARRQLRLAGRGRTSTTARPTRDCASAAPAARRCTDSTPARALNSRTALRQPLVVAGVFDRVRSSPSA